MSHFTVLVIGNDPEALLLPYDENIEVDPYPDYLKEQHPSDHWSWVATLEKGLVTPQDAHDWKAYVRAYNKRWKDDIDEHGEEKLEYDVEKQRPYSMRTYNPKSKWDWYVLGGRWTGFFKLKDGTHAGSLGVPGAFDNAPTEGWVDSVYQFNIDWAGMRAHEEEEAQKRFAKLHNLIGECPRPKRWAEVREQFPNDLDQARKVYNAQPAIQALQSTDFMWYSDIVNDYCLDADDPRSAYVTRCGEKSGVPFAILTEEHGWIEKGTMGWWGVVSDEQSDWTKTAHSIMHSAQYEKSLFNLYDCHI